MELRPGELEEAPQEKEALQEWKLQYQGQKHCRHTAPTA